MAHEYLITKPSGVPLDVPTMRDPSLLVYFRGESGGLRHGRLRAPPGPVGPRRHPARLQRPAAPGGLGALRGADDERGRARARAGGGRGREARQRPGGVHAGRRVHPRRVRRPRLLGRRRLLRARPRRRGRHGAGSSPSGSSRACRASTSGRWTRAASAPPTRARPTRSPARSRSTRPTTTSSTRATSARPAGPLRLSPTYERLQELGAAFGEKSGWERANWFEPNAGRGDESLRPRGWAGRLWSPAIGAEHRACREAAALFDETLVRQARRARAGGGRLPRGALRQPRRARRRCGHVHADAERARRASSATSPSRASPRSASGSSPAPPSASTTRPGSARTRPTTARSSSRT